MESGGGRRRSTDPASPAVRIRRVSCSSPVPFAPAKLRPSSTGFAVEYPHDARAFHPGDSSTTAAPLYESTGLRGRSSLRKVELATGRVVRKRRLSDRLFAEGLALVGGPPCTSSRGPRGPCIRAAPERFLARARVPLCGGGLGPRLGRRAAGDERRQRDAPVSRPGPPSASSARVEVREGARAVGGPQRARVRRRIRCTPTYGNPIEWHASTPRVAP